MTTVTAPPSQETPPAGVREHQRLTSGHLPKWAPWGLLAGSAALTALIFAVMRAKAVGSGLVIVRSAESPGLGGWIGLDKDISQDALDSARLKATKHADAVEQRVGVKAELVISEEDPVDAIRKLIDADPAIKVLVLAAGSGSRVGAEVTVVFRLRGDLDVQAEVGLVVGRPGGAGGEQAGTEAELADDSIELHTGVLVHGWLACRLFCSRQALPRAARSSCSRRWASASCAGVRRWAMAWASSWVCGVLRGRASWLKT